MFFLGGLAIQCIKGLVLSAIHGGGKTGGVVLHFRKNRCIYPAQCNVLKLIIAGLTGIVLYIPGQKKVMQGKRYVRKGDPSTWAREMPYDTIPHEKQIYKASPFKIHSMPPGCILGSQDPGCPILIVDICYERPHEGHGACLLGDTHHNWVGKVFQNVEVWCKGWKVV